MSQLSQLRGEDDAPGADEEDDPPVWYDEDWEQWHTRFPPPPGATVYEENHWGDEDYIPRAHARGNRDRERGRTHDLADVLAEDSAARDAWFAQRAALPEGAEAGGQNVLNLTQPVRFERSRETGLDDARHGSDRRLHCPPSAFLAICRHLPHMLSRYSRISTVYGALRLLLLLSLLPRHRAPRLSDRPQ